MNKRELVRKIEERLSQDLAVLRQSAQSAYEGAIHSESKQEDQYDTRGLEASYLAGAQSRRAEELEQVITLLKFLDIKEFGPEIPVAATALVELESEGKRSWYFLLPKGGGISLEFEGKQIHLITPVSPLGEAILGRKTGDLVDVEIRGGTREYEIISVE